MNRTAAFGLLDELGLDAVVATRCENVTYLGGLYIYTNRTLPGRLSAIVLTRAGDATWIYCSIDDSLIADHTWITDRRPYTEFVDDPVGMVAAYLREKKIDGGRVAVERRYLAADHHAALVERAPGAAWVDAGGYFRRLRMVKTPAEVARVGEAAAVTRKAIEAAFTAARPGDTERQVSTNIVHHMFQMGCDETAFITVAAGANGSRAHHVPDGTPLRRGDVVRIDLGGCFGGYYSDVGRTYVVGEPTRAQADAYRRLRHVYGEVIERMTVGRPIVELYETCRDAYARAGLGFFMPHIGHSIGVEIHEAPMVEPTERGVLVADMTMNIELYHKDGEGHGYFIEDLLHVTAGGPRVLTGRLAPEEIPVVA